MAFGRGADWLFGDSKVRPKILASTSLKVEVPGDADEILDQAFIVASSRRYRTANAFPAV